MNFLILLLCIINLGLNVINFVILRDLDVGDYEDEEDFLDFKER